jgi:hypothetical protein
MNARSISVPCALAAGVCALVCAAVCAVDAAPAQNKQSDANPKKPDVITLSGCVQADDKTPGQFTLADKETGITYRLTGAKVHDFVGQTVLIVGASESKKLVVKGGLYPNPNVAAQGSSIDPARAAVAAQGGAAETGAVELPAFKVKSVKPTGAGGSGCR